jgi:selenium-binding protein 1
VPGTTGEEKQLATLLRPDQSFYPSPRLAGEAPVEMLGYMVTFDPTAKTPDALVTIDRNRDADGDGGGGRRRL